MAGWLELLAALRRSQLSNKSLRLSPPSWQSSCFSKNLQEFAGDRKIGQNPLNIGKKRNFRGGPFFGFFCFHLSRASGEKKKKSGENTRPRFVRFFVGIFFPVSSVSRRNGPKTPTYVEHPISNRYTPDPPGRWSQRLQDT